LRTVTLDIAAIAEDVTVQGAMTGTAATGKTNLPVRELPLTIQSVASEVIREQGANDLVAALQNVPGVYAFTNYGVYEGYTFRGFVDLFPSLGQSACRRCPA
jgi:iron complex outermembrane receptor protein